MGPIGSTPLFRFWVSYLQGDAEALTRSTVRLLERWTIRTIKRRLEAARTPVRLVYTFGVNAQLYFFV